MFYCVQGRVRRMLRVVHTQQNEEGQWRSRPPALYHPHPIPSFSISFFSFSILSGRFQPPFSLFRSFLISPPPPPSNKNCYTSYLQSMDSWDRYSYNPTLSWNPAVHSYFVKAYGHHRFSLISHALTYVCFISSASAAASFFLLLFQRIFEMLMMADIQCF